MVNFHFMIFFNMKSKFKSKYIFHFNFFINLLSTFKDILKGKYLIISDIYFFSFLKLGGKKIEFSYIYNKNNYIELYKVFHTCSKELINIDVNDILKIFTNTSNDGFINIHTFQECHLINSIHIKLKENEIFSSLYYLQLLLNQILNYKIDNKDKVIKLETKRSYLLS